MAQSANPKSLEVIELLQAFQQRDINLVQIEQEIQQSPYRNSILAWLKYLLLNQIPTFQEYDVDYQSLDTDSAPLIKKFCVSLDTTFSDTRMDGILSVLQKYGNSSKAYYECIDILTQSPIHFLEAKFYSDVFLGNRFGFSKKLLQKLTGISSIDNNQPIDKMEPTPVDKRVLPSTPCYGQEYVRGAFFKAVINNGRSIIYDKNSNKCTASFIQLSEKLDRLIPTGDFKIDFIIPYTEKGDFKRITKILAQSKSLDAETIILLDFYKKDDAKVLSERRERMEKLSKRLSKKFNVSIVKSKLLKSRDAIKKFISARIEHDGLALIKEDTRYETGISRFWYLYTSNNAVMEKITITDYRITHDVPAQMKFVVGTMEDGRELVIANFDKELSVKLVNSISNYMGYTAFVETHDGDPILKAIEVPSVY